MRVKSLVNMEDTKFCRSFDEYLMQNLGHSIFRHDVAFFFLFSISGFILYTKCQQMANIKTSPQMSLSILFPYRKHKTGKNLSYRLDLHFYFLPDTACSRILLFFCSSVEYSLCITYYKCLNFSFSNLD